MYASVSMSIYGATLPGATHLARLPAEPSETAKRRLKMIQWYQEHGGKVRLTARHFGFSPDIISRWVRGYREKGVDVHNSTIQGPVSIAEDCRIIDFFIGPFTSIAAGVTIERSCIEHSVILDSCSILNIDRLVDSVVGRCSEIRRQANSFKAVRLFIGDDTRVEI